MTGSGSPGTPRPASSPGDRQLPGAPPGFWVGWRGRRWGGHLIPPGNGETRDSSHTGADKHRPQLSPTVPEFSQVQILIALGGKRKSRQASLSGCFEGARTFSRRLRISLRARGCRRDPDFHLRVGSRDANTRGRRVPSPLAQTCQQLLAERPRRDISPFSRPHPSPPRGPGHSGDPARVTSRTVRHSPSRPGP